jgi:hypothetical protein
MNLERLAPYRGIVRTSSNRDSRRRRTFAVSRTGFVVAGCILLASCAGLAWIAEPLGEASGFGSTRFYIAAAICGTAGFASLVIAWLRLRGWVWTTPYGETASFDRFLVAYARFLLSLAIPIASTMTLAVRVITKRLRGGNERRPESAEAEAEPIRPAQERSGRTGSRTL